RDRLDHAANRRGVVAPVAVEKDDDSGGRRIHPCRAGAAVAALTFDDDPGARHRGDLDGPISASTVDDDDLANEIARYRLNDATNRGLFVDDGDNRGNIWGGLGHRALISDGLAKRLWDWRRQC